MTQTHWSALQYSICLALRQWWARPRNTHFFKTTWFLKGSSYTTQKMEFYYKGFSGRRGWHNLSGPFELGFPKQFWPLHPWSIHGEVSITRHFSVETPYFILISIGSMFGTKRSVLHFFGGVGIYSFRFQEDMVWTGFNRPLQMHYPPKPNRDTPNIPIFERGDTFYNALFLAHSSNLQGVTGVICQVHGSHAKIGISPSTVPWQKERGKGGSTWNIVWSNIDLPSIAEILHHLPKTL